MSTPLELAQSLEAARLSSGLTRQELTEKAGVSRQAVYRLLKGNDVQVSTLMAVMDVLQLDLVTLPRSLRRGLPEFSLVDKIPARVGHTGFAAAAATNTPKTSTHVMSAVQRRLANLNAGTAPPKKT
jgi:transcriptional regulator with XRE-family HTH domain